MAKTTPEHRLNTYAHENSLYSQARKSPRLMERILDGLREADEDLKAMEDWARRGFVGG